VNAATFLWKKSHTFGTNTMSVRASSDRTELDLSGDSPHLGPANHAARDNPDMAEANRMIFLGFGKYARADKIYALEPLGEGERGHGRRTRVWIEGVPDPIVASRTERTILYDMGHDVAANTQIVDQALDLAERIAEQTQAGRVDLADLGRRARRLLESTSTSDQSKLF
jgi:hypothetical protein